MKYIYICKGKEIEVTNEDGVNILGIDMVKCDKCCNKTVLHKVERKDS